MSRPLTLFLPCAAGVEEFLLAEVEGIIGIGADGGTTRQRGGVRLQADWAAVLQLNLRCRMAQRVLVELARAPYRSEHDIYALALGVAWERWFTARETFRVDLTAHASPLRSLQFAALRVKDAVADRFRAQAGGVRPNVDTRRPDVHIRAHLDATHATLYLDTSGEPLFKRGWRQDKGTAPLKETLAAAMLAASGWWQPRRQGVMRVPLYDPCCGSGTIVIEAAQIALGLAAGANRHFAFERLLGHDAALWAATRAQARHGGADSGAAAAIFGSDVAHRMVDFAARNARRAGVAEALQLRGGDALQRLPPSATAGVILMNPPYGTRIEIAGVAAAHERRPREAFAAPAASTPAAGPEPGGEASDADAFFQRLAAHWKAHYGGWTAWILTPDARLPARLRLKETRRVPLWNGPIECRLLRFDLRARDGARQDG